MRKLSAFGAATLLIASSLSCQHGPVSTHSTPSGEYISFSLQACDVVQSELPEIERVAEIVAQRHLNGGLIGFPWNYQGLQQELMGRSGGMVHAGFERPFRKERTDAEKANDVAIISWERAPADRDLQLVKDAKARGCYLIGFGPRRMAALSEEAALCDAWFDTGFGDEDLVVQLDDGSRVGRGNLMMNMLHGWALTAEIVSALTRHGKMPTMWKAYSYEDGKEWGNLYLGKKQFHDEYQIAPIPRGRLSKAYLDQIRLNLRRFQKSEEKIVQKVADMIVAELRQDRPVIVCSMGHAPWTYVGKYEDSRWATPVDLHHNIEHQVDQYREKTPDGALVLRLGYSGQHHEETAIFERKHQREILITSENPLPDWELPTNLVAKIDMGWAFGDACVPIEGYPIKILPPSGIMQLVAYECVNVEVLDRISTTQSVVPGSH